MQKSRHFDILNSEKADNECMPTGEYRLGAEFYVRMES